MYYFKFIQTLTNNKINSYLQLKDVARADKIFFPTINNIEVVNVRTENPNETCYNFAKKFFDNFSIPEDEKYKFSLREYLDEAQENYVINYLENFKKKHNLPFNYNTNKTFFENIENIFEMASNKNLTDDECSFFSSYFDLEY